MKGSKRTVKIGVCGIHEKAGATHLSHMIAPVLKTPQADSLPHLLHSEKFIPVRSAKYSPIPDCNTDIAGKQNIISAWNS